MKITSLLSLTLAAAAPALAANAAPRDLTAEEECGELGVTYIPPGEDPSQYRRCEGHPAYLTPSDPNTWTEDDGPYIRSRDEPKLSTEYIFVEIEPRDDGMETIYPSWVWERFNTRPTGRPPWSSRDIKVVMPGEAKALEEEQEKRMRKERQAWEDWNQKTWKTKQADPVLEL